MNPTIIKALRSLYKIGGIYFDTNTKGARYRMNIQSKCKAKFYCYSESPGYIYIFNYGIGSLEFRDIVRYIEEESGCHFKIIDFTTIKEIL